MKDLFKNWYNFINEGKTKDTYGSEIVDRNKATFKSNPLVEKEKDQASEEDVESAARDLISKEGGAIGRSMLKDPKELKPFLDDMGVELPEDFDLDSFIDEFIEGSKDIGVHKDKDIIAGDGEEVKITKEDIAEGLSIFLEAQEEMLDEKRKRSKRRTKSKRKSKKKKKKGKKDACYYKVKSRYDVWPSAYASGALVKCRKVGAANWGTGGKKNENLELSEVVKETIKEILSEKKWSSSQRSKRAKNCDNPKGFTMKQFCKNQKTKSKAGERKNESLVEADPKKGTGKKPKRSARRLYTDENPKDTVRVKFSTVKDIRDTLSKKTFKSKSHKRQSQIINLIHQRVRVAKRRTKDPVKKKRLTAAFKYISKRKEASKKKTQRMKDKK